jgi:Rieske Fe-S protein
MERRDFLKTTCSFCVLAGAALATGMLDSCSSLPIYKTAMSDNKIAVPVSLFAQTNLQIIRPKQFEYDIALLKSNDGAYTAILLRCTHADNQLGLTGTGFVCTLHGSRFDKQGAVTKGPAQRPLKKYPAEIVSDNIIIHIN